MRVGYEGKEFEQRQRCQYGTGSTYRRAECLGGTRLLKLDSQSTSCSEPALLARCLRVERSAHVLHAMKSDVVYNSESMSCQLCRGTQVVDDLGTKKLH